VSDKRRPNNSQKLLFQEEIHQDHKNFNNTKRKSKRTGFIVVFFKLYQFYSFLWFYHFKELLNIISQN